MESSDSELSEFEIVTRPGGVSGSSGDGESSLDICVGDPIGDTSGEAMGLSGDAEREAEAGGLVDCMLVFLGTVKSLITRRVLRGTTGVPKNC